MYECVCRFVFVFVKLWEKKKRGGTSSFRSARDSSCFLHVSPRAAAARAANSSRTVGPRAHIGLVFVVFFSFINHGLVWLALFCASPGHRKPRRFVTFNPCKPCPHMVSCCCSSSAAPPPSRDERGKQKINTNNVSNEKPSRFSLLLSPRRSSRGSAHQMMKVWRLPGARRRPLPVLW